jgi:2-oxoglutarate dehydrogenase E2 component (dihydrolipoamide succinyltransferase)
MAIEIKVPALPESVADATIAKLHKKVGDRVERDENLVDLETEKVTLEVPSPRAGIIEKIAVSEGDTVTENSLLVVLKEGDNSEAKKENPEATKTQAAEKDDKKTSSTSSSKDTEELSPSVRRLIAEQNVDVSKIKGSGKEGRLTKEDVEKYLSDNKKSKDETPKSEKISMVVGERGEKRVPMSRLRQKIAERLVQVQHEAALLTTFNEVNMKAVMDLRKTYKDAFEKQHGGVRLGFMSFFTKAVVEALKRIPVVNASIDGTDLIYHQYYDIGIAVSSPRGLVVPIIRDADQLGMADIEKNIKDFSDKAKDGKLTIEEMTGGTFTITNGGVFGSMLSTPIINPPQTAILGMHNIVDRAVVENGEIVIRPIMYLALSYDHRVIDGRESVTFLKTIKELIEEPTRLLLGV